MYRVSLLSVVLALVCGCALEVDAGATDPVAYVRAPLTLSTDFSVFVSPSGHDQNDGSARAPFLTVARAHAAILAAKPRGDVYVRLESGQGVYRQQAVNWTFKPAPGKRVFLRPVTWDGRLRPTFHACSATGSDCISRSFLELEVEGESNLSIEHLRFERYGAVLSFEGGTSEATQNSGNEVTGCYFYQIGQFWYPDWQPSTYVVRFINSHENEIAQNWFVSVRNASDNYPELIHPLYFADGSSGNEIHHNAFNISSGEAIKLRNGANFNHIYLNRASQTGVYSLVSDYFKPNTQECPSWGTDIEYNTEDGGYHCADIRFYHDYDNWGRPLPAGCLPPSPGTKRFTSRSNVDAGANGFCNLL